ncbi:hypothetical protein [Streptomyces mirabilis]
MLTVASGIEVPARFGRALEAIAAIVVGLVLSATRGWSWADPIASLVIVAIAVEEGREAWPGKWCCAPTSAVIPEWTGTGTGACRCRSGCELQLTAPGELASRHTSRPRESAAPLLPGERGAGRRGRTRFGDSCAPVSESSP